MVACPSCGTKSKSGWRFCARCGAGLNLDAQGDTSTRRPNPIAAFTVFCTLSVVGVAIWMQILTPKSRIGPPGLPEAIAAIPDDHPPVGRMALPEGVKTFITNLAAKTAGQPDDLAAWEKLAEVQHRAARIDSSYYASALTSFLHILTLDAEHVSASRGLANVYFDLGEYREALPHYERYLTRQPNDAGAQTDLATVRLHLGDIKRAIEDYQKIIATNPPFVQVYYNLGIALHQTGDKQGALRALRRAKELATDDRISTQVERLIARLTNGSVGTDSPHGTRTAFQQAVEKFFRTHEIVGPKLVGVEWTAPTKAAVLVKDFPMEAMPDFARKKFSGRIRELLRKAKAASNATGPAEVTVVDRATRTVMETVVE